MWRISHRLKPLLRVVSFCPCSCQVSSMHILYVGKQFYSLQFKGKGALCLGYRWKQTVYSEAVVTLLQGPSCRMALQTLLRKVK
jgi:hypothetical protein